MKTEPAQVGSVILIQPPTEKNISLGASLAGAEHIGLGYVAAAIESCGIRCGILNFERQLVSPKKAVLQVLKCSPLWVGISAASQSMPWTIKFVRLFKKQSTCLVVCGGNLPTLMEDQFLKEIPEVDLIVLGPGEDAAMTLSEMLSKKSVTFENIANIIFRKNNAFYKTRRDTTSFYQEPFKLWPKRDIADLNSSARILTSLGCPNNCSFCTTPPFYHNKLYIRAVSDVIDEIVFLHQTFKINRFYFNDDNFLTLESASRNRTKQLFQALSDAVPDAEIRILARSDTILKWQSHLPTWRKQGLKSTFIGIESGLQSQLDLLNKNILIDSHFEALNVLSKNDISVTIGFMMFTEGITIEGLQTNLQLLKDIGQLFRTTPLCRCVLGYPGTHLYCKWKLYNTYDKKRSSHFMLYPLFKLESIRQLSIAMEKVELECSPTDARALRFNNVRTQNVLRSSEKRELLYLLNTLQSEYFKAFTTCILKSEDGADNKDIFNEFMQRTSVIRKRVHECNIL